MFKDFRFTVPCVFFNSGVKATISFTNVYLLLHVDYRAVIFSWGFIFASKERVTVGGFPVNYEVALSFSRGVILCINERVSRVPYFPR